jgi:hypothetical protein
MKKGIGEIIQEVQKEKSKKNKIALLRQYEVPALRGMFELAYDKKLVWALPEGNPPYTPLDKSFDAQGHLYAEMRRMYLFIEGGNPNLKPLRREQIFVNMLEELDCDDAAALLEVKARKITGITKKLVQEAWPGFLSDEINK